VALVCPRAEAEEEEEEEALTCLGSCTGEGAGRAARPARPAADSDRGRAAELVLLGFREPFVD